MERLARWLTNRGKENKTPTPPSTIEPPLEKAELVEPAIPQKKEVVIPPIIFTEQNLQALNLFVKGRECSIHDDERALQFYGDALALNPRLLRVHDLRLSICERLERYEQAANDAVAIYQLEPENRTMMTRAGSALARIVYSSARSAGIDPGKLARFEAIEKEIFEKRDRVRYDPDPWDSALLHYEQGDYKNACHELMSVLSQGSSYSQAQRDFAHAFIDAYEHSTGPRWYM